jgi:two-component system sensor histidine kinase KdpD
VSERPDPEMLLRRIREDERPERGRLRIYLGAFPGVGKTYAMLNEARRRTTYGEDVVAAYVETHGRRNTQGMLEGLEVIPRRVVEYQGRESEEMDVEAVVRRHPAVCLVDELAHTNAPGSEHQKRYEDVQQILDAGIDVVATLNVQHLESLNDVVESITGVKVRETIPDSVLDDADEIILIDLSPEGARARMEHGHIYPPDQARVALERFFRKENLAALRELALKRTAQEVDEQLDELMRAAAHAPVEERIVVLIDEAPESRRLIREAWRLAQGLHAEVIVAYFDREATAAQRLDLAKTLELAEDLDARICPIAEAEARPGLTALLKEHGARHLVVHNQPARGIKRLFGRPLYEELAQALPDLQLHLVSPH